MLWAGTDDGLLQISRDGGQNWNNVNPPELPDWALISIIELSPHDKATAYVAATRYKSGRLPAVPVQDERLRRELDAHRQRHPARRLHAHDPRGSQPAWAALLPAPRRESTSRSMTAQLATFPAATCRSVPIHDLLVKGTDLIAATHGRSFWILDDLTPLHTLADAAQAAQDAAQLFPPRPAQRFKTYGRFGDAGLPAKSYGRVGGMMATNYQRAQPNGVVQTQFLDAGQNPPDGVIVHYYLPDEPRGQLLLTFKDDAGNVIREFNSARVTPAPSEGASGAEGMEESDAQGETPTAADKESLKLPTARGLNRFVWNMRYPSATALETSDPVNNPLTMTADQLLGPVAVPGKYSVELTVDGKSMTQSFDIQADPRVSGSQADLKAQFDLLLQIRDKQSETHAAVNQLRGARDQARAWGKRTQDDDLKAAAAALDAKLLAIEEVLAQPKANSPRMFPSGLNEKLAALPGMISNADTRPATQYYAVFKKLSAEIDEQLKLMQAAFKNDVQAFNAQANQAGVVGVVI